MAAPENNQNAAKDAKGVQVNFYLDVDEAEFIRSKLVEDGLEVTDKNVRLYARKYSRNGIALEIYGQCQIAGCWHAGDVTCTIPSDNGFCPGKFCGYHYEQLHLPEDERDEIDIVLNIPASDVRKERTGQ